MSRVGAALLVALSVTAGLGLTELFLRRAVTLEKLTIPLEGYPELGSRGWERIYLRDSLGRSPFKLAGHTLTRFRYDPKLGWDSPTHVRGGHPYQVKKKPRGFRVIALGDSYVWGTEFEHEQSFPYQLEQLIPRGEVLNMGVSAYGIDQEALKYLLYGAKLEHDVVVFGLSDLDYVRVPLSFYRYQKPVFKWDAAKGEAVAPDAPIPQHAETVARLERELGPMSYLFTMLQGIWLHVLYGPFGRQAEERYFGVWDKVIESLLKKVQLAADQAGAHLMVLAIPAGSVFRNEESLAHFVTKDIVHTRLRRIAQSLRLDYVDLAEELPRKLRVDLIPGRFYSNLHGHPGHFNPEGSRAVAEVLLERISKPSQAKSARFTRNTRK